MLSFYDWYADLPVASPQVFGDQTDVPESGDWWNAGYLIMWGSNLPVTRTPDAHWMTEARYRGQKVIAVAPDYADNVKFADEWLPAKPGTDAALAMAMGHVVLKEFFVDRETPYFTQYVKTYTDLPYLVKLDEAADGQYTAGKFLTASDLTRRTPTRRTLPSRPSSSTPAPASRSSRTVPSAIATATPGVGRWNLELGDVDPQLSLLDDGAEETVAGADAALRHPRRRGRRPAARGAGPPRSTGTWSPRCSTCCWPSTASARDGLAGGVAGRVRRRRLAVHAGLAGGHHRRPGLDRRPDRPRVRRERRGVPRPLDDRDGRRHQPLVPLRHDLPRLPHPDQPHRLPRRQRWRLGALRRAGEGPADHRLHPDRERAGLEPAAAQHDPDRLLVPPHQPVPLRPVRCRHPVRDHRARASSPGSPRPT